MTAPDDDAVVVLTLPLDEACELEEHLAVYAQVGATWGFTGEAWVAAQRRDRVLTRLRAALRPTDPAPSNVVDLATRRRL